MICEGTVKRFCCEDISLIENYDKAINDNTQTWDYHHRLETDKNLLRQDLISRNMYYHRPANELIFLTKSEHHSLHHKDKPKSEEHKRKLSESHKDKEPWNKGKKLGPLSEETKQKIRLNLPDRNGENNPMYGKSRSEETRKKQSETLRETWKRRKEKLSSQEAKGL